MRKCQHLASFCEASCHMHATVTRRSIPPLDGTTKVHRYRSEPGRFGIFHQLYDTQRNRGQGERMTIDR